LRPITENSQHRQKVCSQKLYEWIVPQESRSALLVLGRRCYFRFAIACANVANLMAGAFSRQGKGDFDPRRARRGAFAHRPSVAGRSFLACAVGWRLRVTRRGVVGGILKTMVRQLSAPQRLSVDGRVLAFTLLISLATGVLFGLFPALQASQPDLNEH